MYRPTIGLEVHAELKTRTKMFCGSANDPDETRPNVNICPVCMAHPGTLPVINREAVRHILRIGSAIGGTFADFSEFDRKSYFYPDIPKGYQISQYEHPLIVGGELSGIAITRVHLEEDTARSIHSSGKSLVDFNRAGIPLMELVTEPVIPDAETAGKFARELQLLLRTLGASEANLEKGEMRIEANVSVAKSQDTRFNLKSESSKVEPCILGTKVEVKNLNSFRSVERAIAFEIKRQTALIEEGGKVVQETRGWNEAKQETFHQRFKEGSADYRYFPEPDLPKLFLSEIPELSLDAIHASLPELPLERRTRYEALGLKIVDAATIASSPERSAYFDEVVTLLNNDAKLSVIAANYLINDIGDAKPPTVTAFAELVHMLAQNKVSSRGAKDVLHIVMVSGAQSSIVAAQEHGLLQQSDTGQLERIIAMVIGKEEKAVLEYRGGKQAALQYLIGKAMKESGGAGNPDVLRKLIKEKLD